MKNGLLALLLCVFGTVAVAQTTLTLPISDARVLAQRALIAGDAATARTIAESLIAADPNDRAALIIIAAAATQMGEPAVGREAGVRAWRLSRTDAQKYEAARLIAFAAARQERFTLATFWLRRALAVAPNETEVARTTADGARMRQINPWSHSFSFSVVPSNNVNGGADGDILTAPGLPDGALSADAQALAGVRAVLGLRTQYRLAQTSDSRFSVSLGYQGSRVRLADRAVEDGISGRSFATDVADVTLGYDATLAKGRLNAQLTVGTYDFGRADYFDFGRLSLAYTRPVNDRARLQLSARQEQQTYVSDNIGKVTRTTLRAAASHQRPNGDSVGVALGYTASVGDNVNYTFDDLSVEGSYTWAAPVGPVSITVRGGAAWADYPVYQLSPLFPVDGGREDARLFATVDLGLPGASYAGFSPGLSITGRATESNVSRFTGNTVSVGLTFKSTF